MTLLTSQSSTASENGFHAFTLACNEGPSASPMMAGTPESNDTLAWKPSLLVQRRRRHNRRSVRH
ncbi:hypothetical protein [Henriciella sp.]|uniref:hypothetical protein n=1 Tax=Henriciella sp. TaxID=1968823 RepID=UPI0026172302|nr:hypothetical protein [Henriciella sp.]